LGRQQHRSVECQQRPKWMIARLPSAMSQFDRLPYETFVDFGEVHIVNNHTIFHCHSALVVVTGKR